jgi:hypothetical protein
MPRAAVSADDLLPQLQMLARVYEAKWVRLVGGEPLLHPRLIELMEAARASKVARLVSVVTNGVLLSRMDRAFWREVDAIEVSLYPGKELDEEGRKRSLELAEEYDVDLRFISVRVFRESFATLGTSDGRLINRIYSACELAHVWRCHTVADGYFFKCPPAHFLPKVVPACASYNRRDGLEISASEGFAAALRTYLNSPEPLASCRYCLGTAGKRFAHEQVRRADFVGSQTHTSEELVDRPRLMLKRLSPLRLRAAEYFSRLPVSQRGRRLK